MAKNSTPTDRFLDANYEPQQRLTPIQGYEKKELVSLEEAVKPLEDLIENIQSYVWTATGNCENSQDGLSPNERAAIYLYTMECMYCQLNKALRNANRQQIVPYFSYLKLFLTALWKLSDVKCLAYRGVKADISHDYPKGKKFVWWGLSSCTTSLDVLEAEHFLGRREARTLFNVECFNGKNIQNHSHFPSENEIVLLPCSYFEVSSRLDQGNGLHIVHIKQIEPPVTLIQPPSSSFTHTHACNDTTKKTLKLNIFKEKPRLSIRFCLSSQSMAANNDEHFLISYNSSLLLIDKYGQTKHRFEPNFGIHDICWSSYLNEFLILSDGHGYKSGIHLFNINVSGDPEIQEIKRFDEEMRSCACYDKILMISSKNIGEGSTIEEYNLSNWKLKTRFQPPISCKMEEHIHRLQFNSSGSCLGVLLIDAEPKHHDYHWCFQLRRPNNMNILQIVPLDTDRLCGLTALANEQFLVNTCTKVEFFLIDSDGKLKETMQYRDNANKLISTVCIGTKCLVVATQSPDELRFYDL